MSLYDSLLPKATSPEVIKIIAGIGGSEIQHFEVWQDKAGNAPPVVDNNGSVLFPQLLMAPEQTPNGVDPADPMDTNQIMPRPMHVHQCGPAPLCCGSSGVNGQNRSRGYLCRVYRIRSFRGTKPELLRPHLRAGSTGRSSPTRVRLSLELRGVRPTGSAKSNGLPGPAWQAEPESLRTN